MTRALRARIAVVGLLSLACGAGGSSGHREKTTACYHAQSEALLKATLDSLGPAAKLQFSDTSVQTEFTRAVLTDSVNVWGSDAGATVEVWIPGVVSNTGQSQLGVLVASETAGYWVLNTRDGKRLVATAGLYRPVDGGVVSVDSDAPLADFEAQMTAIHATGECPDAGQYSEAP